MEKAKFEGVLEVLAFELKEADAILEDVAGRGRLHLVIREMKAVAEAAMKAGMAWWRVRHDLERAFACYATGLEVVAKARQMAEALPMPLETGFIREYLDMPLWLCLLAGAWEEGDHLAGLLEHPRADAEPGKYGARADAYARLPAALAQGHDQAAREACAVLGGVKEMRATVVAVEALLARDSDAFATALESNDEQWRNRSRGQQEWPCVFGGPGCGHLVLDFESLALCRLARRRGMDVDYDSEIIPRAVYTRPDLDEQPAELDPALA